nr:hypothetical protein BaRGS_015961 [Batillaria attramentaria]
MYFMLVEILYYHVVPGTLYKAGLHESYLHTFREADRLHITSHFGVAIENGYILPDGEDMSAVNGVVHKMDHVLIPNSLKSQI